MRKPWFLIFLPFLALPGCLDPIVGAESVRPSCDGHCGLDAGVPFDVSGEAAGQQEAGSAGIDGGSAIDGSSSGLDAEPVDAGPASFDAAGGDLGVDGDAGAFAKDSSFEGKRPFDARTDWPETSDGAGSDAADAGKNTRPDAGDARDAAVLRKDAPILNDVPPDVSDVAVDVIDAPEDIAPDVPRGIDVGADTRIDTLIDATPDGAQAAVDVTIDVLDNIDTASTVDSHRTWSGRLIVMGHDFATNQPTMDKILGNAVLLPPTDPVVIVPYEGAAASASVANANAAITQSASSAGRSIQWLGAVNADNLPSQLPIADVLLIYGQENATDTDLAQWAEQWKDALTIFVQTGGTIVLLDGYYGANVGTCQILDLTGLLAVARRYGATGNVCDVVAPTDPLVAGLPQAYLCTKNSVQYRLSESGANVTSVVASGDPVVVDKTF